MHASAALRACMLGLVLISLVFVQLTGAAEPRFLAPLYALTLAAPLLYRLREKLLYRLAWNAGILGVFVLLIRHAGGEDLRFVLEDGLLLAGLCQVHLLNNLRSDQRPDLLFFNAFLIASVTGFLSRDLGFALAFLVFAPLFVLGLQFQCVTRDGEQLDAATTRRIAKDGFLRAGLLLGTTLLVFFFWPRDFKRQSFLAGEFDFSTPDAGIQVGFAEKLALERKRRVQSSSRVALRATLLRGRPEDVSTLWRGATLGATDGTSWWAFERDAYPADERSDDSWALAGESYERTKSAGPSVARISIEHLDHTTERLFAPLAARRVTLEGPGSGALSLRLDGTLEWEEARADGASRRYGLEIAGAGLDSDRARSLGGRFPKRVQRGLGRHTALPRSRYVRPAVELAAELAAKLPAEAPQHGLVSAFRDHLEENFEYLRPGSEDAAVTIAEFLAGDSGAHCEMFAATLASMLRSQGVPCRIVTGYRSAEWDGAGRVLTFRSLNAHAWVEVFDPVGSWYAVDVYPDTAATAAPGLWARLQSSLTQSWNRLASFDAEGRASATAWIRGLPSRSWSWVQAHPGRAALFALGLLVATLVLNSRRAGGLPADVRFYRRVLKRLGLTLLPGETPRELLARAEALGTREARMEDLRTATNEHERSRYAT